MKCSLSIRIAFGIIALTGISALILFISRTGTVITEENAKRIKPGMTQAEVEGILGRPRDETFGRANAAWDFYCPGLLLCCVHQHWISEETAITVTFDFDGVVMNADSGKPVLSEPTWKEVWTLLKQRIGLQSPAPWGQPRAQFPVRISYNVNAGIIVPDRTAPAIENGQK